ncbi:MAG: hypothetical protein K6L81_18040 [Agarilytica sp.]
MSDTIIDINTSRRERLKSYFGLGLPARELDLDFPPPPTSRRIKKPNLSTIAIERELKQEGKVPLRRLEKIREDMLKINGYRISPAARTRVTQYYWHKIYALAQQMYKTFGKVGTVPDKGNRAQHLDITIELLDQIRKSYQYLFAHYYDYPNWRYGPCREKIYDAAFRILEVVQLQQQISALRYRDLNTSTWRGLNKIFYVMREYESVEVPILLTRSRIKYNATQVKETISDIYLRIQLTGYFDALRYSVAQQRILNIYIRSKSSSIVMSKLEQSSLLGGDHLIIGYDQDHIPDAQSEAAENQTRGTLISLKAVRADLFSIHEDLNKPENRQNQFLVKSAHFRKVPPKNRSSLFNILYRRVQSDYSKFRSLTTRNAVNLLVYSGFMDCYELKLDQKRPDAQKRVLRSRLAERSAFIGEDDQAEVQSLWYCLYNNNNTMLLQTQETRYTIPLSVGSLIAFSYKGEDMPYTLASVSKIERLIEDQVNIELTLVTDSAEAVTLTSLIEEKIDGKNKKYPALLVIKPQGWLLVMHHSYISKRMQHFLISRDKKETEAYLSTQLFAAEEFSVFSLSNKDGEPLGAMDNKPHVRSTIDI